MADALAVPRRGAVADARPNARAGASGAGARGATIGCAAAALPARLLGNGEIAARLGIAESWIEARTGVRSRHCLAEGERLSDLAAAAGARALRRAGLAPADVGLVLVATTTPDELMPNAAPLVAGRLGAVNAAAFDVGAACTAYVAALQVAAAQLECGRVRTALVIGADALSRHLDMDDRRTAPLFGDGAGATVMAAARATRIGPVVLRAAEALNLLHIRHGAKLAMRGHETFAAAVSRLEEVTLEALRRAGADVGEVDLFVYHQANARILRALRGRLGVPEGRVLDCIAGYGNTSAASIPIALAHAESDGRLRAGMRVLVGAFGAGFTWGATLVEWGLDAA